MAGRRLAKVRDVEQCELGNSRVYCGDPGNFRNSIDQRLWRSSHQGKDIGKAIALVVGIARLIQRPEGTDREDERGDGAGNDERDGQRLGPEPLHVTKEFQVEDVHAFTR